MALTAADTTTTGRSSQGLERMGMTAEDVQQIAHGVLHRWLRQHNASLSKERYEDAHSYLVVIACDYATRYRSERHNQSSYKPSSWIGDILERRIVDWYRSELGDNRYGNGAKVILSDDPDPADHELDFEELVSERRRARWQAAANSTGWGLSEWIVITLDRGADELLKPRSK